MLYFYCVFGVGLSSAAYWQCLWTLILCWLRKGQNGTNNWPQTAFIHNLLVNPWVVQWRKWEVTAERREGWISEGLNRECVFKTSVTRGTSVPGIKDPLLIPLQLKDFIDSSALKPSGSEYLINQRREVVFVYVRNQWLMFLPLLNQ